MKRAGLWNYFYVLVSDRHSLSADPQVWVLELVSGRNKMVLDHLYIYEHALLNSCLKFVMLNLHSKASYLCLD